MTYEQRHTWAIDRSIIEVLAATIHLEKEERDHVCGWLAELAVVSSERHNGGPLKDEPADEPTVRQ